MRGAIEGKSKAWRSPSNWPAFVALTLVVLVFISPLNIYRHRKCEVLGRNSGFTAVNDSVYCPEL